MKEAIKQALLCTNDVPVGCVIKQNGKIIAKAHNMREANSDVTAHAEILAIQEAQKKIQSSRLQGCEMYVTLEPCPMCSWAIIQSKISTVYFGAYNKDYGALLSNPFSQMLPLVKYKTKVYGGIEEDMCNKILEDFFDKIR